MTFLAPLGLLALLTLPIIVILHFRRERLRRVMVSSLMLWQYVAPTTGKQRKLILPVSLLLLLHLLVAGFLALALGQPQWVGRLLGDSQQDVILVLDTSTSMAAGEGFGSTRMENARRRARELLDEPGPGNNLSLITVDTQAHLVTTGSTNNRAGLLAALDELQATGTGTNLAEALTLAGVASEQAAQEGRSSRIVVISDLDEPEGRALPVDRVEWMTVGGATDNQAIVALAAEPKRGSLAGYDAYIRIANYDTTSTSAQLRLFGDDELISTRDVNLQGNGEAEFTWSLPAGIRVLRAELDSEDALPDDNLAYLNLATARPVRVVLVSDPTTALNRVLGALPGLNIAVVQPADYALSPVASQADLTIFNGFLPEQWPVGGVLVINPPAGENTLLNVETSQAQPADGAAVPLQAVRITPTEHSGELLDGLSLGSVRFGALLRVEPPDWAQVQLLANDNPLILRGQTGESEIAVWAFDPASTNLASKLAFPLLVARTVSDLTTPGLPSSVMVGQTLSIEPGPHSDRIEVQGPDGDIRRIPISRTLILEGLTQPGLYEFNEYADGEVVYESSIAVNAGTPLESDLSRRPLPSNVASFTALDATVSGDEDEAVQHTPQQVWHWFALAALLVMIIEWFYVHWR